MFPKLCSAFCLHWVVNCHAVPKSDYEAMDELPPKLLLSRESPEEKYRRKELAEEVEDVALKGCERPFLGK